MGNNAAPPIAIIYMNYIELRIMEKIPQINYWRRYIDDIFIVIDQSLTWEYVLQVANSICPKIQFTFEGPNSSGTIYHSWTSMLSLAVLTKQHYT